jgi:hypothetical protein
MGPQTDNIEYEAYLRLISYSLQQLRANTINIKSKYIKLVVDSILPNANPTYI